MILHLFLCCALLETGQNIPCHSWHNPTTCSSKVVPSTSNITQRLTQSSSVLRSTPVTQICRKIWGQGQSGQAIKLFQITPYINYFQTLNNPGSWQPVGASKNYRSSTFHFWRKSFVLDDVKLAELLTTVLSERMWLLWEGQNIRWRLLHIFRGHDPHASEDIHSCQRVETNLKYMLSA